MRRSADTETLSHITLFRGSNAWMIDVQDDPSAGETLELFGGTVLPTPFTLAASLDRVVLSLRQRNPGVIIRFTEDK
jgi:hypothetical protein